MSVLSWIGRTFGLTDGGFWSAWIGARNAAQKDVNFNSALTVATAWACVKILSQSGGLLPYHIYRKLPDGSREPVSDHPLYTIIHEAPNPDMTAGTFWESVVGCLVLQGDAFAMKMRLGDDTSRVVGLELLDPRPGFMNVTRDSRTNKLRYQFNFRNKPYDLDGDQVIHWRGFGIGGDRGLSAIAYGANTLGIAMAGDDQAGANFSNGGLSPGFVKTGGPVLDPNQREQFRKSLKDFKGTNSDFMLLEGAFDYVSLGIKPDDMQLLESRGFSVEEVCRLFLVPPFMVGHTEKVTSFGSGLEQQLIGFLTFSLLPILKKIWTRTDLAMLAPGERKAGLYTEFNMEGLLKADSAGRAALYSVVAQNGILTRNEIRELENRKRMPGGDSLTVQSNLVPLELLGTAAGMSADQARNALRSWLGVPEDRPGPAESTDARPS